MKATKIFLSIFFIFYSFEGFSQIIQDTAICATIGSSASFTVDYPSPSTYAWQVRISGSWTTITSVNAGTVYSGYSSSTLTITKSSTLPVTGTLYRVIVNNGTFFTSNEAKITVNPEPTSKTISGASPVCAGGSKTLTYGTGSVVTIQWQSSTTDPNSDLELDYFSDITGETERTYTATDLQETTWFRVMNSSGECAPVFSDAVKVVVNPLPVAGNIDGGDINVCSGSNTTKLTLYNYVGAIQWQKALEVAGSPGTPGTFANITSAISPNYSATNLTATTYFRAVLSSGVCPSVTTDPVAIIVDPVPVSKLITGASPVCAGGSKTLTYATGSKGDIQWQFSNTGILYDFSDIGGATKLMYTATDLQETTWFRVKNTSGEVCAPAYSPAVQVVVDLFPISGYVAGGNINVCKTLNATELTLYNYAGAIQWQKASDIEGAPVEFLPIASETSATYSAAALTATTHFRAVLSSGVCASETTESVVIIVDPVPLSGSITGAAPVCAGESKTLTYATGSKGDIQWQYSTTGNSDNFYDIYGETELIYTANYLQETTWFRVMNSSGECGSVYSPAVQVIVNPLAVAGYIEGGYINVCKTSNATELTLYDYAGTIQWQKASDIEGAPDEFLPIASETSATYSAAALTATTHFRAVLSSGVCASETTESVVIIVDPVPLSGSITGAAPVCAGESKTLTYATGSKGDIQWQYSTTGNLDNFYEIDGTELTYTATDLQDTTWFRVKNSSGTCSPAYSSAVQVIVNPFPIAGYVAGGDINVCKTSNTTELTLYDYAGAIQWQKASEVAGSPGTPGIFEDIPSAILPDYSANNLTATTYFRAEVSSGVCTSEKTTPVVIIVDPTPVSKIITGVSPVCVGGSKTLTYGTDSVGTIQWQSSSTSSPDDFRDLSNKNGLTYFATNLQETTWFRVMNSSGECGSVYSPAVQVVVNPLAVITISPTPTITTCSVQNITLIASGGSSYLWSNGTVGSSLVVATTKATYSVIGTDTNGCSATAYKTVDIYPTPSTSISADATVANSTTITEGSAVPLKLNGSLNVSPNIQWTPATAISSTTISNPIVYPSTTTTYTASFINTYGCPQTTSIQVNVTPQPTIGNLSINSSNTTIGLFDTINVDIQLAGATSLYSLFMKLKGNTAVNQYLDYSGYTSSTLLGSGNSVISTPPTVTNSVCDFGITSVGTSTGYSGSGLFYTLHFTPKNMLIPDGTVFCFYIDDVNAYNNSGIPCGLTNQGQYCYTYTNQVNVWPGDLNNSKTVTTADILPIGYFYNFTGPTRPNATIQWTAQPMTLWGGAYNHSTTNGNAYKVFADSNGDGVINNADQAAIGFNMSKIQARLAAPKTVTKNYTSKLAVSGGELIVTPNTSNINALLPQTVSFNVSLNNLGGLASLYGISVNLLFDDTFFDLSTATVGYANSIFGNAGKDFLMMNYTSANMVSVGLTRYANAAINGQGLLFKVTLQTKSHTALSLTQTPVTAYVDAANNQAGDSLVVQDAPVTNFTVINNLSVNTMKKDEFLLYPNPANEILYIATGMGAAQLNNLSLKVFNSLGQSVYEIPIENSNMEISTKNWGSSGVYFIKIFDASNNLIENKKIILN